MSGTQSAAAPGINILQPWSPQQLAADAQASAAIMQLGTRYDQIIASIGGVPVAGQPLLVNVVPQNVGLINKFTVIVDVTVTVPAGASGPLTRGSLAPFNALSSITYTDPNQYQRINTTGWHMASVTAMRHRRVPGAALATDTPSGFGSVLVPMSAPASIAPGASGLVRCQYEIPLAYTRGSLKGAVFSGAVFATQQLQLVINPTLVAPAGSDDVNICYSGADPAHPPTMVSAVTVWQDYYDGFPLGLLSAISPSLSTIYELKVSGFTALAPNLDNYARFSNLRQFMSATIYFDNAGEKNYGSDIGYFALQSANQTTLWKRTVPRQSYITRQMFGDDFPVQMYPFDFRAAPIITAAEGNTVLVMNPTNVQPNAVMLVGWEDIGVNTVLASAPSLAGNVGTSP
jgi:P3 major capsid protein